MLSRKIKLKLNIFGHIEPQQNKKVAITRIQLIQEGKLFYKTLSDVNSRRPFSTKSMFSTFPSLESSFKLRKAFSLSSASFFTANNRRQIQ